MPRNVRWIGHVGTANHNVINSSAHMVLNINRESMAKVGYSPPTRVFEAAGAAACLITDAWLGIEQFYEPEREVLVAHSSDEIVRYLREIGPEQAQEIGCAMHKRALRDHTYRLRAREVDDILRRSLMTARPASESLVESAR